MGNFNIKVKVEIEESEDLIIDRPIKAEGDCIKLTISEADAISIDKCENALLKTSHEAIRDGISRHLEAVSKKKTIERIDGGQLITNEHPYDVEGEVGRFQFQTHRVEKDEEVIFNSEKSVFPKKNGKEKYKTSGYKEIALIYGVVKNSYRKTALLLNRIRYQEEATPMRTLQDNTEREGGKLLEFIEQKTKDIFNKNNFSEEGVPHELEKYKVKDVLLVPKDEVKKAIEACKLSADKVNEIEKNPVCYEDVSQTVNISIDDVIVKKQKEIRDKKKQEETKKEKKESTYNTIAHIQKDDMFYIVNGYSVVSTLRVVIGFLINNDLLKQRLQFFVDGQKTLKSTIVKSFLWFNNIGIILDWYHLKEKCKGQLSMAMKGRKSRNNVLAELMYLLWYGMTDKAIEYLNNLDETIMKKTDARDKLIGYIERNRSHIPCYAVRKRLGLRNSSNIGEKMNDLVVSNRQKHNGMSWSKSGSVALASLTALERNKEHASWFGQGDVKFELVA